MILFKVFFLWITVLYSQSSQCVVSAGLYQRMETWIPHVASPITEPVSAADGSESEFIVFTEPKLCCPPCPDPPTTLNVGESVAQRKRRTLVAPDMNLSLDQSEGSVLSDDFLETPDDLDINVDDIETPEETDSLEFINNGNDLEWEGQMMPTVFPFTCTASGSTSHLISVCCLLYNKTQKTVTTLWAYTKSSCFQSVLVFTEAEATESFCVCTYFLVPSNLFWQKCFQTSG